MEENELAVMLREFYYVVDEKELCNFLLFSYAICKIKKLPKQEIMGHPESDYIANWQAKTQDDAKLLRKIGIFYYAYKKIPPLDFGKWAVKNNARVQELTKIANIFGLEVPAVFRLAMLASGKLK